MNNTMEYKGYVGSVDQQLRGRRAQNYAVRTQITKTTQVGQNAWLCVVLRYIS